MDRIYLLVVCLLTINCYCLDDNDSLEKFIEGSHNIKIETHLPFEGCPKSLLVHEAETEFYNDTKMSIKTLEDQGIVMRYLHKAKQRILAKLDRAQEFRNHIHLVLSDLLANAEYDLKAKSPGDSDGISLDELRAIQEQIRKISVLSANNADLLQFMEGNGLDKLESSLKEDLQVIPQASKSLIIEIISAYKSKTERYPLDLLKNGKLKVYLGVATSVSADAPAKPTLEVSSPAGQVSVDAPAKSLPSRFLSGFRNIATSMFSKSSEQTGQSSERKKPLSKRKKPLSKRKKQKRHPNENILESPLDSDMGVQVDSDAYGDPVVTLGEQNHYNQ